MLKNNSDSKENKCQAANAETGRNRRCTILPLNHVLKVALVEDENFELTSKP